MAAQPAAGPEPAHAVIAPDAHVALVAQPSTSHASQHPQEAPAPQQAAVPTEQPQKEVNLYDVARALGRYVEVRVVAARVEEAQQASHKLKGAAGLQPPPWFTSYPPPRR